MRHVWPCLIVLAGCGPAPRTDPPPGLANLAERYGIEIVAADPGFPVKNSHGSIGGKAPDAKSLAAYVPLFAAEFSLWPPSMVKKAKLKRVVLCESLSFAGQPRAAVPDFQHDTYYLDVSIGADGGNNLYQRKVLHHDLFHVVDWRDDGVLYGDDRWKRLNPGEFKYGKGGRHAQDATGSGELTDTHPGFLNLYSQSGVEEDKAEVFANLMVEPKRVMAFAAKDPVLKAKVERLKEIVSEFCPDAKAEFWRRAAELKRE